MTVRWALLVLLTLLMAAAVYGEPEGYTLAIGPLTANAQEQDLERRAMTIAGLLEPALILAMGVVVLLIVLAVLMPIIEINQLVR